MNLEKYGFAAGNSESTEQGVGWGSMKIIPLPRTVFIVEAEDSLSQSLKCLLESHERSVQIYTHYEEFWIEGDHRDNDIVLLNFERRSTNGFKLLNRLLSAARRPHIVIASSDESIFEESDRFIGGGVTVLFHPVTPADLVETINRLEVGL